MGRRRSEDDVTDSDASYARTEPEEVDSDASVRNAPRIQERHGILCADCEKKLTVVSNKRKRPLPPPLDDTRSRRPKKTTRRSKLAAESLSPKRVVDRRQRTASQRTAYRRPLQYPKRTPYAKEHSGYEQLKARSERVLCSCNEDVENGDMLTSRGEEDPKDGVVDSEIALMTNEERSSSQRLIDGEEMENPRSKKRRRKETLESDEIRE